MLMKVFNKGQIVIPVALRRELGVEPGDMIDLTIDKKEHCLKLKKPEQSIEKLIELSKLTSQQMKTLLKCATDKSLYFKLT